MEQNKTKSNKIKHIIYLFSSFVFPAQSSFLFVLATGEVVTGAEQGCGFSRQTHYLGLGREKAILPAIESPASTLTINTHTPIRKAMVKFVRCRTTATAQQQTCHLDAVCMSSTQKTNTQTPSDTIRHSQTLTRTLTIRRNQTLADSHTRTLTVGHNQTLVDSHSHSQSDTRRRSHSHNQTLADAHTLTIRLSQTLTLTLTIGLSQTLTLTIRLSQTHTLTRRLLHTHTNADTKCTENTQNTQDLQKTTPPPYCVGSGGRQQQPEDCDANWTGR